MNKTMMDEDSHRRGRRGGGGIMVNVTGVARFRPSLFFVVSQLLLNLARIATIIIVHIQGGRGGKSRRNMCGIVASDA